MTSLLPDRLRLLRQEKKLTQMAMAREILVPRVTYTHYELGKRTPDLATLILLARYHQVSIDYLIGCTNLRPTLEQWLRDNVQTQIHPQADYPDEIEQTICLVADLPPDV